MILELEAKLSGNTCTEDPIVTCVMLDVGILPLELQFLAFQMRLVMLLQPANALEPIEETELPMVTLVRPLQYWNALLPIEVTDVGMVTLVNPVQL